MKLQPLRIPTGWKVNWNMFLEETDPDLFIDNNYPYRSQFDEDILQIQKGNFIVDIGWYPNCEVEGSYLLVLVNDDNWSNPILSFETRNKTELTEQIEYILEKY